MTKAKKIYEVDTENVFSYYETFDEAVKDFKNWVKFYNENKGKYGSRTIKLFLNYGKSQKTLCECFISE